MIAVEGRKCSFDEKIQEGKIYHYSTKKASDAADAAWQKSVPDLQPYPLACVILPEYKQKGKRFSLAYSCRMRKTVVKVISRFETRVIIKLFKHIQVNWGSGPNAPSLFVILDLSTKYLNPPFHNGPATEHESILLQSKPEPISRGWTFELSHSECLICMDESADFCCSQERHDAPRGHRPGSPARRPGPHRGYYHQCCR